MVAVFVCVCPFRIWNSFRLVSVETGQSRFSVLISSPQGYLSQDSFCLHEKSEGERVVTVCLTHYSQVSRKCILLLKHVLLPTRQTCVLLMELLNANRVCLRTESPVTFSQVSGPLVWLTDYIGK